MAGGLGPGQGVAEERFALLEEVLPVLSNVKTATTREIRRNTFRSRFWLPAFADSVGPPLRFHDLRRSHVALLIKQGTHPAVIAARLGHVSVKPVLDVYGHLSEGLDRDAADTLQPPWSESDVHAMCTRHPERRKH